MSNKSHKKFVMDYDKPENDEQIPYTLKKEPVYNDVEIAIRHFKKVSWFKKGKENFFWFDEHKDNCFNCKHSKISEHYIYKCTAIPFTPFAVQKTDICRMFKTRGLPNARD